MKALPASPPIFPVRKDPEGNELRLQEILDPIERSVFEDLHKAIAAKDLPQFSESYEPMLDSCHACHLASGKPFLRLRIPDRPPEPMIHFEPQP